MNKNLVLLALSQALMMTSMSLIGTVSGLVGHSLTEDKALATLPHALQYVGMMSVTFPASLLMGRIGRQLGFLVGVTFALLGASIAAGAIVLGHFWLFCLGSGLVGCSTGFGQYYRFAAADVASVAYRSRAISWVLSGGIVAAFAGPNLAGFTQHLVGDTAFVGGYVTVIVLGCVSFLFILLVRVPKVDPTHIEGPARPLREIIRDPTYAIAVVCGAVAYTTMALVMTATPLAMKANGLPFQDTVLVIQWHILGMYGPTFFTGHIIRKFGVLRVMQTGAVLVRIVCRGQSIGGFHWLRLARPVHHRGGMELSVYWCDNVADGDLQRGGEIACPRVQRLGAFFWRSVRGIAVWHDAFLPWLGHAQCHDARSAGCCDGTDFLVARLSSAHRGAYCGLVRERADVEKRAPDIGGTGNMNRGQSGRTGPFHVHQGVVEK